jgi:hypothetical protein
MELRMPASLRLLALLLIATACSGTTDPSGARNGSGGGGGSPGVPDLGVLASLNGARPFPNNNPWNTAIDGDPLDPSSAKIIATIGTGGHLHPDFGTEPTYGIPYVVVAGTQKKLAVTFSYSGESDPGPYPIPANPPIEGGAGSSGDRHILIIDRDHWILYELYAAYHTSGGWTAGSGAIFDLSSNALRPAGWTSADAAGLPIFPGLVRYDEVVGQGEIRHAVRFTVQRSRHAYVAPATHYASSSTNDSLPPMGARIRLKASFDISTFPPQSRVILQALKTYGMIVADNGSNWYISGASDPRWDDNDLNSLKTVPGSAFEVVQMGPLTTN